MPNIITSDTFTLSSTETNSQSFPSARWGRKGRAEIRVKKERESDEERKRERITSNILTPSKRQTSVKQFPLYKMGLGWLEIRGWGGRGQDTGGKERAMRSERGRESP